MMGSDWGDWVNLRVSKVGRGVRPFRHGGPGEITRGEVRGHTLLEKKGGQKDAEKGENLGGKKSN